ncbi:MAG TPA: Do family serine endopeptidase [Desulfomonilia bacterium]|nr:Do family serine endopeptidase [Desulfomonilia bacterium]
MRNYRRPVMVALIALFYHFSCMPGSAYGADPDQQGAQKPLFSNDLRVVFSQIAKAIIPSVVHIEVTQQQLAPFSPFLDIPQSPFSEQPQAPKKFKRELKGLGTGIIIDENGNILTNNHVVDEATDIKVILPDGRHYAAHVVGKDQKTDLAIIRIRSDSKLPFVTFGDSDKVEVGEWVEAIGHPRGLDQTVTQGIISAKHRQGITDPSSYQDFLQTDAAINPGNSGGPLINLKGEVIGINSIIASESGGYEGIGFAIPSNLAVSISKALIAYGKVKRGWVGVTIQDLDPEKAKSLNLQVVKGAMVMDVIKGGPADKAGLKKDDVIVKLDGKEVLESGSLRNQVANTPIGNILDVGILHDGREKGIRITVGDMDDSLKYLSSVVKQRLGVEVRALKTQEADNYGIDSGVAVKWLDPKGSMVDAGFETGDIILEIDGQAIHNAEDFAGIVSVLQVGQDTVILALDHRSGQSTYVQLKTR